MHMNIGERDNGSRRFGYVPLECATWVETMRERLGDEVGFLLDIGHARNNAPFSKRISLGHWYARMGRATVGYHIHQQALESSAHHRHVRAVDLLFLVSVGMEKRATRASSCVHRGAGPGGTSSQLAHRPWLCRWMNVTFSDP